MQTRTRHSTVRFCHPFSLAGLPDALPAGEYDIAEDDQVVEGLSWTAWHRVATYIHLPAKHINARARQMMAVDQSDLDGALERDRKRSQESETL
jgi:hypothetical protein